MTRLPALGAAVVLLLPQCPALGADVAAGAGSPPVRLDVVVRDSRGRLVPGLDGSAFEVTENGAPVAVAAARFRDAARENRTAPVSLLFAQLGNDTAGPVRDAAQELISAGAAANVRFAVYQVDQALRLLQGFTADRKLLARAVRLATGKQRGKAPPDQSPAEGDLATDRVLRTAAGMARENGLGPQLAALLALARAQQDTPERKAVVLFSEGLPVPSIDAEPFRIIVSAANQANVSIYTVDAGALAISAQEQKMREVWTVSPGLYGMNLAALADPYANMASGVGNVALRKRDEALRGPAPDPVSPALLALAEQTGGFGVARGGSLRKTMRRIPEDLGGYYELTYSPPGNLDGAYRATTVALNRGKLTVQGRGGYYAMPNLPGSAAQPYAAPLLEALERPAPVQDFPHEAAVLRFRGDRGRPAQSLMVGVATRHLQFAQDGAGLLRARFSLLALVRDAGGAVAASFARDVPMQVTERLLAELQGRFLTYSKDLELPPGDYTLESVVRDQESGKLSMKKSRFTVAPAMPGFGMSSVAVVEEVAPAEPDGAAGAVFRLGDKVVMPAGDGAVRGGRGAVASLFVKLYAAEDTAAPFELELEVLRDSKPAIRGPVKLPAPPGKMLAQVLKVDVSRLPAGAYNVRLIARQGPHRAEEQTRMTIGGGAEPAAAAEAESGQAGVAAPSFDELQTAVPTAGQQRLIAGARETVMRYSERLPDFLCTQVTRRLLDETGTGGWRNLGDVTHLLSYYDGAEHYAAIVDRSIAGKHQAAPPAMTSAGEFGSLLRKIFDPASQARFGWLRQDRLRGRPVQVFTYSVDQARSTYRVSYARTGAYTPSVYSAYHGLVFIDRDTGGIRRVTLETGPLPNGFPVRHVTLALDYDDTAVGGNLYLLPLSVDIELRLRKKTVVRNEISFRSYQRFTATSRIVKYTP
jgi:VWFA-related protein